MGARRSDASSESVVRIAKALGDPTRYRMLHAVGSAGELTCAELGELFTLSQPTISHHIRTLEEAGVMSSRRAGPFHYVRVNRSAIEGFLKRVAPPAKRPVTGTRTKRTAK